MNRNSVLLRPSPLLLSLIPKPKHGKNSPALLTSSRTPRATAITSNGLPTRSLNNAFRWKTIVSNRGLRSGLVGTPEQVSERIAEFEDAGANLLLLQFSPQLEEMERFAAQVIQPSSKPLAKVINGFASRETRRAAIG